MFFLHSSGIMFNTTFPVMDEVFPCWAMPELVHQDCVKLIGYGGSPKLDCALKPLSILNMRFNHNVSAHFSN